MPIRTASAIKSPLKIGILGGGQLARFLVEKGQNLGVEIHVLSENGSDPAAQVTKNWSKGHPGDKNDLGDFLKSLSHLTFESEFADVNLLKELSPKGLQIFPTLNHIKLFQDRLLQKSTLEGHLIDTSPFFEVSHLVDLNRCGDFFKYKYVLKKRFGGYDGYGTYVVKNKKQHLKLAASELDYKIGFIAESFISFDFECAATFFRNSSNQWTHSPLVFSKQSHSKCDFVFGPIYHKGFEAMKKRIKVLMTKLDYVGALTFEFFSNGNELIVNETAPRVHNSAHYSLDALSQDQFTLHIKSILNWDLSIPIVPRSKEFCMVNLVGQTGALVSIPKNLSGTLYWYGKTQNRPGRKMGHINYTSNELDSKNLVKLAQKERTRFKL